MIAVQKVGSMEEEVESQLGLPEGWGKSAAPSRLFEGESDTVRRERAAERKVRKRRSLIADPHLPRKDRRCKLSTR